MTTFDGSLARTLDFPEIATRPAPANGAVRAALRFAPPDERLQGPAKYEALDRRRRRAQIMSRRVLDLFDLAERRPEETSEGTIAPVIKR